jgi:parallel beta-helix repeat protein
MTMSAKTHIQRLMGIACVCSLAAVAGATQVLYVDAAGGGDGSSWENACPYLQDALALAAGAARPVEIRVAQGVYKPDQGAGRTPGDVLATFQLLNGVTLKGGYAGAAGPDPNACDPQRYQTILSGDLRGDDGSHKTRDNSLHLVTGSGTDGTAVMDGFTVTGGTNPGVIPPGESIPIGGTGMLIDAGSPAVRNCCFTDNSVRVISYGAVQARNGSSPVLTNCTFVNNEEGGMCTLDNSNSVLTNCRFEGNGLWSRASSPIITGCRFTVNPYEGMIASGGYPILTDCVFEGTGAGPVGRGIKATDSHLSLTNCIFTDFRGGAIFMTGNLDLLRCTFVRNGGTWYPLRCDGFLLARECTFTANMGPTVGALSVRDIELHDCEFTGNSGSAAGAIETRIGEIMIADGCLFSGNSGGSRARTIASSAEIFRLSNCTFVGNRGPAPTIWHWQDSQTQEVGVTQCIIRDDPNWLDQQPAGRPPIRVTWSNIRGRYPGEGNIDVDPCFVDPGYWANPNDPAQEVGPHDPCAVWVPGDYHLKSQGGHWDRATAAWVRDDVTSACIDAGNPVNPLGLESFPNGGVVNLGAYGGSAEASKSYWGEPVCETQIPGDINGDCKVDQTDMDILQAHWLQEAIEPANLPPTIAIISPVEGAEFTYPEPLVLRVAASDPDGRVLRVSYTIKYDVPGQWRWIMGMTTDPADDWAAPWSWLDVVEDTPCVISAEAMDNRGATTAAVPVTVTLHPMK